jgi:uncharacterized DUF497 family protein
MSSQQQSAFEWDPKKDRENQAQYAFADPNRVILEDVTHSTQSERCFFCLGVVGEGILTVRFTYRKQSIRIFGAGYWRKGKQIYEQQNQV